MHVSRSASVYNSSRPQRTLFVKIMTPSEIDYSSYFEEGQPGDCRPLKPSMVRLAEESLGYRLPKAYVRLLRVCNGGALKRNAFRMPKSADSDQRIEYIHDVMGIGKQAGINSKQGSKYLIREWDYPKIGVVIASEGETAVMLDYSQCGPEGEPKVVFVDVELGDDEPYVDVIAENFESFLQMLHADAAH